MRWALAKEVGWVNSYQRAKRACSSSLEGARLEPFTPMPFPAAHIPHGRGS